jgi:hypothetical protein
LPGWIDINEIMAQGFFDHVAIQFLFRQPRCTRAPAIFIDGIQPLGKEP